MELISIVVPCYNEEQTIPLFYDEMIRVTKQFKNCTFEFIFVDDGSSDKTLSILKKYHQKDKKVRYLSFSRNFGKEAAIYAGLSYAKGDFVALMDADLQDPPSLLPQMYTYAKEGYENIATRRVNRKGEPKIRSFFARLFYKIINRLSKVEMVDGARDYRFMSRKVVDAILSLQEYNRYSKGLFSFVGFETKWIEYENRNRIAGETKWNFWRLFIYGIDGITAFSTVPLVLSAVLGVLFCFISFIAIIIIIVKTSIYGDKVGGWPSTVCILFFVSGVQLFCLGIIGQYLSKTYLEAKKRPIYIIKETEKDKKIV